MGSNPIMLTADDVGVEMMRRDGRRVELIDYHYMNGTLKFLFSDMIWRFSNGCVLQHTAMPDDLVARISEQVA